MNYEYILLIICIGVPALAIGCACTRLRHAYVVQEGFVGMLHRHGVLVDALPAGRYICWGRNCSITLIDNRRTVLLIPAQQALTADNVSVTISVALTTRVVNAVKAVQAVAGDHATHLYSAAQTAIRTAIAEVGIDDLPDRRPAISTQILKSLAELEETIGVHVHEVDVRDMKMPDGLRLLGSRNFNNQ